MKIKSLNARQIFDSKNDPTLSVKVELDDGTTAVADVPAGASTGRNEAQEKRDSDGKGVSQAIENVNIKIAAALENQPADNQALIDKIMLEIDGTPNKAKIGANAMIGVSLAVCRAAAKAKKLELFQYLGSLFKQENFDLPQPLMLLIEGGRHGHWATNIQEYFVIPQKESFASFKAAFEAGKEVFYALELILKEKGYATNLGFEGGYCPQLKSDKEALELITQAIKRTGFNLGKDLILGLDCAASEFWEQGTYLLKNQGNFRLTSSEWSKILESWLDAYPLYLLEDPFAEEDWESWQTFFKTIKKIEQKKTAGQKIEIVADDLTVTKVARIEKAAALEACNAVIIKPNQVGTLTETLEAIKAVKLAGWQAVVSHRGGETNDDFIADLCVGTGCTQGKFGGPSKPERLVKYNRLITIEELLKG